VPKVKVSTVLDEQLLRRAKLAAVRQGTTLADLIGEALEGHLGESRHSGRSSVADASFGALAMDRARVRQLIEEEPGLLDT
jgi:hypothetical protein